MKLVNEKPRTESTPIDSENERLRDMLESMRKQRDQVLAAFTDAEANVAQLGRRLGSAQRELATALKKVAELSRAAEAAKPAATDAPAGDANADAENPDAAAA